MTRQEWISSGYIVAVLTQVAERRDEPEARRAAEDLLRVLGKSENVLTAMKELRAARVALCSRLDAAGAAATRATSAKATRVEVLARRT